MKKTRHNLALRIIALATAVSLTLPQPGMSARVTSQKSALAPRGGIDERKKAEFYEAILREEVQRKFEAGVEDVPFLTLKEAFKRNELQIPPIRFEVRENSILAVPPGDDALFVLNNTNEKTTLSIIPGLLEMKASEMEIASHLPMYLWLEFKAALEMARRDGQVSADVYDRIVKQGLGIARTNGAGNIIMEETAIPVLRDVLNRETTRAPPKAPLTDKDVIDYLIYHEKLHREIKHSPELQSQIRTMSEQLRDYSAPGSMIPDYAALKQYFINNYGEEYADDMKFAEELYVVCRTEGELLHQPLRLLADTAMPKDRILLPSGVRDLIDAIKPNDILARPAGKTTRRAAAVQASDEAVGELKPLQLSDGAKIVVIGGGPAGSFFAITLLRKAREMGIHLDLTIIERKKESSFFGTIGPTACRAGCNFCVGGISPRMNDVLKELNLIIPENIKQGSVKTIVIQGHWKNMDLEVPKDREMFSVFRGDKPRGRTDKEYNFDAFLLEKAIEEGAKVITGDVEEVNRSEEGRPIVSYRTKEGVKTIETDFTAVAGGVGSPNVRQVFEDNKLVKSLQRLTGFKPPKVRRTMIFELEAGEEFTRHMKDTVHFIEYGSKELKIEMCSIIPKGKFVTVALIGESIDEAGVGDNQDIAKKFLELPHIKRIFPANVKLGPVCICNPNMVVGTAENFYGDRIAGIGDIVTSRLYKDGILSAHITSSALADAILSEGVDKDSLRRAYFPVIEKMRIDNLFGEIVFKLNRLVFSSPRLSRIVYQAVFTERKYKPKGKRVLGNLLWKIASGDDDYKSILKAMFHPNSIFLILTGGFMVTLRNYLTERLFGLEWHGLGRYTTGVYKESVIAKRSALARKFNLQLLKTPTEFESMYRIRIRADRESIWEQLGKFGNKDREYFTPRWVDVERVRGEPNQPGYEVKYKIFGLFSFTTVLENVIEGHYLVYRVKDGYAKGGVLVFDITDISKGFYKLSIYVGFNFEKGTGIFQKIFWAMFRLLFPHFLHDVLWNHAFCKIKDIVEMEQLQRVEGRPTSAKVVKPVKGEAEKPPKALWTAEQRGLKEDIRIDMADSAA